MLWSVTNGYHGYGPTAALVEADDEVAAISAASAALKADADGHYSDDYWMPDNLKAVRVVLPYVGDEMP